MADVVVKPISIPDRYEHKSFFEAKIAMLDITAAANGWIRSDVHDDGEYIDAFYKPADPEAAAKLDKTFITGRGKYGAATFKVDTESHEGEVIYTIDADGLSERLCFNSTEDAHYVSASSIEFNSLLTELNKAIEPKKAENIVINH